MAGRLQQLVIYTLVGSRYALQPSLRRSVSTRATISRGEMSIEATESATTALTLGVPKVVTVDPIEVLVCASLPEGLVYRDALMSATGLMLPRPDVFQEAFERSVAAAAPRFGAGVESAASWWRGVTLGTYNAVLRSEAGLYDDAELASFDKCFDALFDELQSELFVGADFWRADPDAPRLLAALREWRDLGGGPRVGVVSDRFDDRLEGLLRKVLGDDVVDATFDFVVSAVDGDDSGFDAAAAKHGVSNEGCVHVALAAPPDCPYATLLVDTSDLAEDRDPDARTSLLDLLDDWNLDKVDGDDIITTSRTYSVYDPDPPGTEVF